MRWNGITILVALVLFSVSCARKPEQSLVGEWKGTDSTGQTVSIVLNSDRIFTIVQGNLVMDGPMVGGKVEWRTDTSRYPMTLDLISTSSSGQRILPMIFRFISDHQIQIRFGGDFGQSRPANFSADDTTNQLVLTKQSIASVPIAQPRPPLDQPGERKITVRSESAPQSQSPTAPERDEFRDQPQTAPQRFDRNNRRPAKPGGCDKGYHKSPCQNADRRTRESVVHVAITQNKCFARMRCAYKAECAGCSRALDSPEINRAWEPLLASANPDLVRRSVPQNPKSVQEMSKQTCHFGNKPRDY